MNLNFDNINAIISKSTFGMYKTREKLKKQMTE